MVPAKTDSTMSAARTMARILSFVSVIVSFCIRNDSPESRSLSCRVCGLVDPATGRGTPEDNLGILNVLWYQPGR